MARPGEAPPALYSGLPYGENMLANDMSEAISDDDDADLFDDGFDELDGFQPADEQEEFLFSQTDRPDEPLTAGMSFGAGPNIGAPMLRAETRQEFTGRVARTLEAEGEQTPGMRKFLDALNRGL